MTTYSRHHAGPVVDDGQGYPLSTRVLMVISTVTGTFAVGMAVFGLSVLATL